MFLTYCFLFPAIHSCATDAAADLAGLEGGERAVAGGPTGDVHGTQRNESRPGPGTSSPPFPYTLTLKLQLGLNSVEWTLIVASTQVVLSINKAFLFIHYRHCWRAQIIRQGVYKNMTIRS